ncbi:HNH endonuclease [Okeania sp. SIO1I7]|uniref:HNH endonuclease n=1 Tax=Okeania sp. SIO1I7 TaxID=2607772 RepID=UPI0013F8BCDB|nr:HNH endonuclease [Okeania sp. SIO1I7]NET30223.1 HNH endonuclease [Okeania sp. SIO1I7]
MPLCKQYFTSEDNLEIDHIVPQSLGGKNNMANKQLVHIAMCTGIFTNYKNCPIAKSLILSVFYSSCCLLPDELLPAHSAIIIVIIAKLPLTAAVNARKLTRRSRMKGNFHVRF